LDLTQKQKAKDIIYSLDFFGDFWYYKAPLKLICIPVVFVSYKSIFWGYFFKNVSL
jgi:hypothetical protein